MTFVEGDATALDFPDASFDAVLGHSVLESGADAARVLEEARRVLRPDGWIGVASVEYGGLVLAGPDADLLRRSNAVREGLWQHSGANPFLGRELRRLLGEAGFADVEATTKAFGYGTPALVRAFADGRGSECADQEYVAEAVHAGLDDGRRAGRDGRRVGDLGRLARRLRRIHLVPGRRPPASRGGPVTSAFVYAATRTPFGRFGGALADVRPDDLAASAVTAVLAKAPGLDPERIGDVVWGNANGAGEDNRNVGRMAVLLAGLPPRCPP